MHSLCHISIFINLKSTLINKLFRLPLNYTFSLPRLPKFKNMNIIYVWTIIALLIHSSLGFSVFNVFSKIVSPFYEQCDSSWVTRNIAGLEDDLNSNVFGQELAVDVILTALRSHLLKTNYKKPLVLSFHGWTGGGKTYVKDFILKHWFLKGDKSNFVKLYFAEKDFPVQDEISVQEYKNKIHDDLEETIKLCPRSMFVFDEVDKYPPHVLDAIKSYLDYNSNIKGYDYRQAIFIFITNTGGGLITKIALKNWEQGIRREDLRLRDFEEAIRTLSFNDQGGFYRSDLIKHHLIDYIVPFLPLERSHVQSCIEAALAQTRTDGISDQDLQLAVRDILENITFEPKENAIYASQGCHNIEPKIYVQLEEIKKKYRRRKKYEL